MMHTSGAHTTIGPVRAGPSFFFRKDEPPCFDSLDFVNDNPLLNLASVLAEGLRHTYRCGESHDFPSKRRDPARLVDYEVGIAFLTSTPVHSHRTAARLSSLWLCSAASPHSILRLTMLLPLEARFLASGKTAPL